MITFAPEIITEFVTEISKVLWIDKNIGFYFKTQEDMKKYFKVKTSLSGGL